MSDGQPTKPLKFNSGVHSPDTYAEKFLTPLFDKGTITPFPGADYYAICYGELCAYADRLDDDPQLAAAGHHKLLAIWSHGVPDCEEDEHLFAGCDFAGSWEPE